MFLNVFHTNSISPHFGKLELKTFYRILQYFTDEKLLIIAIYESF